MVVFNCNACGEALKKNQVEKHYQSVCRTCEVISCVDCGKDFWGDTYKEHTKCISEEEKYSGKNYKPKPNANKGEAKQEAWLEKVQETIDKSNPEPRLKDLLVRLKDYPNIPRKKTKFENFLSNSLRVYDHGLSTKVWDLLMTNVEKTNGSTNKTNNNNDNKDQLSKNESKTEGKNETRSEPETTESTNGECSSKLSKREKKEERKKKANKVEKKDLVSQPMNDDVDENVKPKKKKKRKHEADDFDELSLNAERTSNSQESKKSKKKRKGDEITEDTLPQCVSENANDSGVLDVSQSSEDTGNEPTRKKQKVKIHFDWESVIFTVLKSKSDREMSIKKLKKKVISEYLAQGGFVQTEEKLWAKFDKKVNSNKSLKVHKDKVKLVE